MKSRSLLFAFASLASFPLHAQVTVVAPATPVVEVVRPAEPLNPNDAQRRLSVAPQIVVVPTASVETTTTITETKAPPARVYNAQRNVVVVQEQGQSRELPYVTLPVLFVKETADLLGDQSRTALEQIAGIILAISRTEAGTVFDIEGHTSTDGAEDYNLELSAARAKKVYDELTQRYGVPPEVLSAHGYGEAFPMYPNGKEDEMQMDRRVLVVRTK